MKRKYCIVLVVMAVSLPAQTRPGGVPIGGLIRGVVFETRNGEFSIRSGLGDLIRFRFDSRTWIERATERVSGTSLEPGELLEIVTDRDDAPLKYARLIHVIRRVADRPPPREGKMRLYQKAVDKRVEPVSLAFSGVAVAVSEDRILLKTRLDGWKTIFLRPDTLCLRDGRVVPPTQIAPQTRVFIKGWRNFDKDLEADEIIWGELLKSDNQWQ